MGRGMLKLSDGESVWYLEWSTVVDAPVTCGMSADELEAYVRERHGSEAMETWWPKARERLEAKSTTSAYAENHIEVMRANRAGAGETCLSPAEIIEVYCKRQHIARDGRCLLKGKHAHGFQWPVKCDWEADASAPVSRDELHGLRERAALKKELP